MTAGRDMCCSNWSEKQRSSYIWKQRNRESCLGPQTEICTVSRVQISLKSAHISNTASLPRRRNSCTSELTTRQSLGEGEGGVAFRSGVRVRWFREGGGGVVLESIARVS